MQVALEHDVGYIECLDYIRAARSRGLKAPVLLMGASSILLLRREQLPRTYSRALP